MFLRIEQLFVAVAHALEQDSEWATRTALEGLSGLLDLLSRMDVKTELIKELERHYSTMAPLRDNPGVDHDRLAELLTRIEQLLQPLKDSGYQPGSLLKENELVSSLRNRRNIPGGPGSFDLPGFYRWLQQPAEVRQADVESWMQDLSILRQAVTLALQVIRSSSSPSLEQGICGLYQQPIESGVPCQLIRVELDASSPYFPEISAGKHRFTVRFMSQPDTAERQEQTQEEVPFYLHCCII